MFDSPPSGKRFSSIFPVAFVLLLCPALAWADETSFSREVLPVLSDRCFHCHGPDEENREADLRLDLESAAKADLGGYAAVVPAKLEESELWRRIITDDEDARMPPTDSHRKPLSDQERKAILQWILDGAQWGKHWSFEALRRPDVPSGKEHPIDAFVLERLSRDGLSLSRPAAPTTLLRRLSLDLTGMTPSPQELRDNTEWTDERWLTEIDRLLQSPHHAERMAMWWLDAARYSDSDGYQQDATRQNWPWRDWVIQQFRDNKPFDEFTIEQFAGDLLPDATAEQKLATCFHRNHMTNGEGGRDPEQSRIDYVIDRVNTTGTVWLGLTLGCVQCHSHKFDPITQHDYYSLFAFFNSIDEDGRAGSGAKPYLKYTSPQVEDRIEEMQAYREQIQVKVDAERKLAEARFERWLEAFRLELPEDYQPWITLPPKVSSVEGTTFVVDSEHVIQTVGPDPFQDDYKIVLQVPQDMKQVSGFRIEVMPHDSHKGGRYARSGNGEFALTSVLAMGQRQGSPAEQQVPLSRAVASVQADPARKTQWEAKMYSGIGNTLNDDARNGWTTEGIEDKETRVGLYQLGKPWSIEPGDRFIILLRHRSTHGSANIGRFRISVTGELGQTVTNIDATSPVADLIKSLKSEPQKTLDGGLRKRLLDQFLLGDVVYQQKRDRAVLAHNQLGAVKKEAHPRSVMVLAEREKPRDTHVLERGVWDAKGDKVGRGFIPSVLDQPADQASSRLDLAKWLMDADNPLTARVTVNHLWQLMFGRGLVRTPEDFGLQGELPTHPDLLDWLAVELIDSDWDLRHILRLIATSKTYQQSSSVTKQLLEMDPENRLLARAPRHRLPAWMIRDNALHVSGLLNDAVGGPPVRPYQPEGVWAEITMGRFSYKPSVGPERFRRTIYGFWRRSAAPTFLFDSAQRRVCEVGVRRTNTPLHALTLMNDTTMLEASRALADLVVTRDEEFDDTKAQHWQYAPIQQGLQTLAPRILSRKLADVELKQVHAYWFRSLQYYNDHVDEAVRYTTIGQQESPSREVAAATAAWMTTASLLLNLDEAMTRE